MFAWSIAIACCVLGQDVGTDNRAPEVPAEFLNRQPVDRATLDRRQGYRIKPGVIYAGPHVPSPIRETELDRFSSLLRLSEAQRVQLARLYNEYLESDWQRRLIEVQPLIERAAEYSAMRQKSQSVDVAHFGAQLSLDQGAAIELIAAREEQFLRELVPFLTETQIMDLDRVRDLRSRTRNRMHVVVFSPGTDLDLTDLLWQLKQDGHDLTPSDRALFDNELRTYEQSATRLLDQIAQFRLQHGWKSSLLLAQMNELFATSDALESARSAAKPLQVEKLQLASQLHNSYRRMHDLNHRSVDLLAAYLPENAADAFQNLFRERAYRVIFPDVYDAEEIFLQTLALESITNEQYATVAAVHESFRQRRDELAAKMIGEYLLWHERREKVGGYEPADLGDYQQTMQRLQKQRRENANENIAVLKSLLDESQRAEIAGPLKTFNERVHGFNPGMSRMGQSGGWPGPFD